MKKALTLILALALCFALAAPALAADYTYAVVSPQTLKVDGAIYRCEKYNIDGSNYFKLRDLAYLLNYTGSSFSVGWDAETYTVSIATGGEYQAIGKELLLGADASATAQKTAQTILIDGEKVTDINVYNIGGSNYFRLRDLGDALGFDVEFDADTNTAVVTSRPARFLKTHEKESGTYTSSEVDLDGNETETTGPYVYTYDYTYTADGKLLTEAFVEEKDGEETDKSTTTYTYDAAGRRATATFKYSDGSETKIVYNAKGDMTQYSYTSDGGTNSTAYTYNGKGYLSKEVFTSDSYNSTTEYTYDAKNNLVSEKSVNSEGDEWSITYTYDDAGNCLTETYNGSGGFKTETVNTYNKAGCLLTSEYTALFSDGDTSSDRTVNSYDGLNNLIRSEYRSTSVWGGETTSESYVSVYTYDASGRLLHSETENSDGTREENTITYDKNGNELTNVYSSTGEEAFSWRYTYTYDADGRLVKAEEDWNGSKSVTTYTYDANGNLTRQESTDGFLMVAEYKENKA